MDAGASVYFPPWRDPLESTCPGGGPYPAQCSEFRTVLGRRVSARRRRRRVVRTNDRKKLNLETGERRAYGRSKTIFGTPPLGSRNRAGAGRAAVRAVLHHQSHGPRPGPRNQSVHRREPRWTPVGRIQRRRYDLYVDVAVVERRKQACLATPWFRSSTTARRFTTPSLRRIRSVPTGLRFARRVPVEHRRSGDSSAIAPSADHLSHRPCRRGDSTPHLSPRGDGFLSQTREEFELAKRFNARSPSMPHVAICTRCLK